jgi:PAS domain S-box-containing protein
MPRLKEERAEDLLAFLETVVENIPNMVFVKDAEELRFVRFNRAGEELLGWKREALIGKNDYDFFPKEEADWFTSKDRAVLAGGQLLDIPEEVIQTAHGRRYLHTRKVPLVDADGKPAFLLGISEDITESRQAALELKRLNAELERSNTELEQFAYVASHDLQEPLRTIASYLQLLSRRYKGRLDGDADDFIDFAVNGAKRLQAMIDGLLAFSRAGTRELKRQPVALNELADEVLRELAEGIRTGQATVSRGELPTVQGDPLQLAQVLRNLVGNAIKFRRADPPRVRISAEPRDGAWAIAVSDNGIGIAPEDQASLFGVFRRLHGVDAYPGCGIGLAICKRIVERHGGSIELSSARGEGSTFTFVLPDRHDGVA